MTTRTTARPRMTYADKMRALRLTRTAYADWNATERATLPEAEREAEQARRDALADMCDEFGHAAVFEAVAFAHRRNRRGGR